MDYVYLLFGGFYVPRDDFAILTRGLVYYVPTYEWHEHRELHAAWTRNREDDSSWTRNRPDSVNWRSM
jgi:hypothetical protein